MHPKIDKDLLGFYFDIECSNRHKGIVFEFLGDNKLPYVGSYTLESGRIAITCGPLSKDNLKRLFSILLPG